jgi:hypothetical protein
MQSFVVALFADLSKNQSFAKTGLGQTQVQMVEARAVSAGEDCAKIRGDNNWGESNCGGEAPYLCRTCHQAGGGRGKPPPPPPARGSCSCDYTFHDGPANWNTAEDTCVAAGGHLASVHSQANADAFHTLVSDHGAGTAWLGFTDSVEEGTFIWADGSSNSDYANWASGEPNEWGGERAHGTSLSVFLLRN